MATLDAMIDAACRREATGWDYAVARRVLNTVADQLACAKNDRSRALEAAALLYYGARQARGIKSEVAFRRFLAASLRRASRLATPAHIESWVAHAKTLMGSQ